MFFKSHSRKFAGRFTIIVIVSAMMVSGDCFAEHDNISKDDEQYQLGKKVFADYCSRCHGEHADGRGKATPLYVKMRSSRPSNFQIKFFSFRPKQYMTNIIRDGGEKHSLSEYMPPFGGELSKGQINNVIYFIQQLSTNIALARNNNIVKADTK